MKKIYDKFTHEWEEVSNNDYLELSTSPYWKQRYTMKKQKKQTKTAKQRPYFIGIFNKLCLCPKCAVQLRRLDNKEKKRISKELTQND